MISTRIAFLLLLLTASGGTAQRAQEQPAPLLTPPWSQGRNNPASPKGYIFQVGDIDNVPDLHGNPEGARLVLFIGGNQFFVLPRLVAGFERLHPDLAGHIFYETLPPGILRKQIANGGFLTLGNLTFHAVPDVYEAGGRVLDEMQKQGQVDHVTRYTTNTLEIMVAAGNPERIKTLADLAAPALTLSMPNPAWEGVARPIGDSLRKTGGEALYHAIYKEKVQARTTYLTRIHHRETPMRILEGKSAAGVTWASEVRFQQKIGNPIGGVVIPGKQNTTAVYSAGVMQSAPHRAAAEAWVAYMRSGEAQAAYREYGFGAYPPPAPESDQ